MRIECKGCKKDLDIRAGTVVFCCIFCGSKYPLENVEKHSVAGPYDHCTAVMMSWVTGINTYNCFDICEVLSQDQYVAMMKKYGYDVEIVNQDNWYTFTAVRRTQ